MAIDYNIMGERIKKARLEKQLTQENIAEKLDVSVAFLSRIERVIFFLCCCLSRFGISR